MDLNPKSLLPSLGILLIKPTTIRVIHNKYLYTYLLIFVFKVFARRRAVVISTLHNIIQKRQRDGMYSELYCLDIDLLLTTSINFFRLRKQRGRHQILKVQCGKEWSFWIWTSMCRAPNVSQNIKRLVVQENWLAFHAPWEIFVILLVKNACTMYDLQFAVGTGFIALYSQD